MVAVRAAVVVKSACRFLHGNTDLLPFIGSFKVPLRQAFEGILARFSSNFPRTVPSENRSLSAAAVNGYAASVSGLLRPEGATIAWPKSPAEISVSFLANIFEQDVVAFQVEPLSGRIRYVDVDHLEKHN